MPDVEVAVSVFPSDPEERRAVAHEMNLPQNARLAQEIRRLRAGLASALDCLAAESVRVRSPFTDSQVEALHAWQRNPAVHSFTCPTCGWDLVPGKHWTCTGCDYTQYWAHPFMAGTATTPEEAL
jgi:hypothetical protein